MYILKNAYLSIIRNKGRNILIGIIILVIACACSVTLAIKNSASLLIKSYSEKYDVTASLEMNRESLMKNFNKDDEDKTKSKENMIEQFNNIPKITVSDVENYGNSQYVKSYYYTNSVGLNASNIEAASSSMQNNENMQNDMKAPDGNDKKDNMVSTDFTLTGYSSYEAMTDFISGTYTISEGEINSDFNSNYCVINSELATLNNLKTGDVITLVNPNDTSKTYELIISGIFSENENDTDSKMSMFSKSANTIITNSNFINNIVSSDSSLNSNLNPVFVLQNKDVIESFESELKEKGLSDYLTLKTNLDDVESATKSISNVSTFATTFLIITLAIGAIVLFVLNMINVRERKYEIGVLRTIGMSKLSLTTQFMCELLIITIIFLILGTAIGASISVPTANSLLEKEISSSNEQSQNINNNFGGKMMENGPGNDRSMKINGLSNIQQIDSINAVVDFNVILQLLGIGIALTLVSSLASMISIQRFSPLTILKERS